MIHELAHEGGARRMGGVVRVVLAEADSVIRSTGLAPEHLASTGHPGVCQALARIIYQPENWPKKGLWD